jgi:hypothetical protein
MPIVTHPLPLSISFWRLERAGRGDEKNVDEKEKAFVIDISK